MPWPFPTSGWNPVGRNLEDEFTTVLLIPLLSDLGEAEARDRGQGRHVRALQRARPRRGSGGRPRDGLLRRPRRPAGHHRDGRWTAADEVHIAYGLSGWHPTAGTRAAGAVSRQRRGGRRVRYANGRLEYRHDSPPTLEWPFPEPMGTRSVIGEFTMADVVTVPSHLSVPEVRTYMTVEAASDVSAPDTPAPTAADERGRSAQTFLVRRRRTLRRRRTARRGKGPGHLRRHRAARRGSGRPHPHGTDQDGRCRLRRRGVRRARLPARTVPAHHLGPAPVTGGLPSRGPVAPGTSGRTRTPGGPGKTTRTPRSLPSGAGRGAGPGRASAARSGARRRAAGRPRRRRGRRG